MAAVAPGQIEAPAPEVEALAATASKPPAVDAIETREPETASRNYVLLAALSVAHFANDFYIGITAPMIPTMEVKFGLTLGQVAGIVTIMAIIGNFTQPIAGLFMDRSRTVRILFATPLVVALSSLIGLTNAAWQAAVLLGFAGLALATFHPYALVVATHTMPRRPALATSIFISFGFFGVSTGAMVSGMWMERFGFAGFHYTYLMPLAMVAMLAFVRLDRVRIDTYRGTEVRPSADIGGRREKRTIHFAMLYGIGLLIAWEVGTLTFFTPKLFKELYGSEGLGGQATFAFGLLGGLSSYYYGYLADRTNPYRVVMGLQLLGWAPMIGFFYFEDAAARFVMIALVGATLGGSFSLMAALARGSRGLSLGLRLSIAIGGVWGSASLINLFVAQLPALGFELENVMAAICVVPLALVPWLAFAAKKYEV